MLAPVAFLNNGVKDRESRQRPRRRSPKDDKKPKPMAPAAPIKAGDHIDITA